MPKGKPHGPPAPADIKTIIDRYYDECREKQPGKSKQYCSRVAWTRFCQHKNPDHPSCTKYGKTGATMKENRPFRELFALLEGHPHHDGAVEREEFNTLAEPKPMDAEAREAMSEYVLERLPPSLKFVTAKNEQGLVYHDSRGRAVETTIGDIDDGELSKLAERLGFTNEREPVPPEMPDDFVEPTADNTGYGQRGVNGDYMADVRSIVRA